EHFAGGWFGATITARVNSWRMVCELANMVYHLRNMNQQPMKRILVAGAGSIGIGVARSFAASGFEVTVLSRDPKRLEAKLPAGAKAAAELPAEAPHLVVESIPEQA